MMIKRVSIQVKTIADVNIVIERTLKDWCRIEKYKDSDYEARLNNETCIEFNTKDWKLVEYRWHRIISGKHEVWKASSIWKTNFRFIT